jgi:hypothetical protein
MCSKELKMSEGESERKMSEGELDAIRKVRELEGESERKISSEIIYSEGLENMGNTCMLYECNNSNVKGCAA